MVEWNELVVCMARAVKIRGGGGVARGFWVNFVCHDDLGVSIHWTGILLDYWTGLYCTGILDWTTGVTFERKLILVTKINVLRLPPCFRNTSLRLTMCTDSLWLINLHWKIACGLIGQSSIPVQYLVVQSSEWIYPVGLGKLCWHNFDHNSFIYPCQHKT